MNSACRRPTCAGDKANNPVTKQTTPAQDGDIEESERTVMAVITVDGKDVEVGDKEQLNVIQAADRAGVPIPFYCWHPGLSVVASCRMCLVEVGSKNKDTGEVAMQPRLVPACQTPAKDGTVVVTNSAKVKANQNFVQEGLLLDHPIDCPICDQAGECWLQDYYFNYGHQQRRADVRPFNSRRKDLGEHVTLFVDRCVMCSRCVRFTREVSGEGELQVIQRGAHAEIDIFPDHPINNSLSGNVNDLCPVGALCSKDFLYNQRVWFMQAHNGVCTGCSAGCSVQRQVSENKLHRIQPRYNPNANDWWMCDIGRYENGHVHAPERIDSVMKRGTDGKFEAVDWSVGLKEINDLLYDAVIQHGRGRWRSCCRRSCRAKKRSSSRSTPGRSTRRCRCTWARSRWRTATKRSRPGSPSGLNAPPIVWGSKRSFGTSRKARSTRGPSWCPRSTPARCASPT